VTATPIRYSVTSVPVYDVYSAQIGAQLKRYGRDIAKWGRYDNPTRPALIFR